MVKGAKGAIRYVLSRVSRKLLLDMWCPSARLMRAESLDSGLAFSGGNGSLLVSSSARFHVKKLAQTKSQGVIITMRASLRHVEGYALYYWWAVSRSDQYCRFDATKIAPLIGVWFSLLVNFENQRSVKRERIQTGITTRQGHIALNLIPNSVQIGYVLLEEKTFLWNINARTDERADTGPT